MGVVESELLANKSWVPRRAINVDEFYRMAEAGIFHEDDRVELIEGEIIEMSPIGSDHSGTVNALTHFLVQAVGDRAVVSVQNPVRLSHITEPLPDFVVLKPRADFYRERTAKPEDVLLIVEVAKTSARYDKLIKVPLYARHAIPEYWLVRLDKRLIEVHRDPADGKYRSVAEVNAGAALDIERLPGIAIPASSVLGTT
jgi:Uma2 family endonuclease